MFYKIMKDDRVIDVVDKLVYLKWNKKHHVFLLCTLDEAQAIRLSDRKTICHEETLYNLPVDGYDTVRAIEIDQYEYRQLKILNGKTPEEIIDEFVLSMIEDGSL